MTQLELHLIINANAGSGSAAQAAKDVLDMLAAEKIPHYSYYTKYPGHAIELTKHLVETTLIDWDDIEIGHAFPLLVVLGGDGTLHEVVNALGEQLTIPIGYLPAGSGNDFARGIGLTRQPVAALQQLLQTSEPQFFTLLHYHEKIQNEEGLCTNNLGVGVDAAIVAKANASKTKKKLNKYHLGSLSYVTAAISVLFHQKQFPILLDVNGQEHAYTKTFLCTTTNHPYFGGGVAIAPDANPKEPTLEIIIVDKINIFKLIYLLILLANKKHLHSKYIHHFKAKQLQLTSISPEFGQVDGEELGQRSFDLEIKTCQRLFWI